MSFDFALRLEQAVDLYDDTPLFVGCPSVRAQARRIGPVITCDDPNLDAHGHFLTHLGIVPRRSRYTNPLFSGLFTRHELEHTEAFRGRRVSGDFQEWTSWMVSVELGASLTSECYVYLEIPELREHVFKHPIWIDDFLAWKRMPSLADGIALWAQSRFERLVRQGKPPRDSAWLRTWIRAQRLRAMAAPEFNNYVERQIWNYGQQNMQWCCLWGRPVGYGPFAKRPAWRVVEEHMSNIDWSSPQVLDRHRAWLNQVTDPDTGIPFDRQAKAFAPIYEASCRNFGNDVLSG